MNYKELHKELWTWLADNPTKEKHDWPRWAENGGDIPRVPANCFACEVDDHRRRSGDCYCSQCPIGDCDPEFVKWRYADNNSDRTKWALQLADKEWKESD